MKKFTLLCAAAMAAVGVNAQTLIEWDENGQFTFYPEDFIAEGSISWNADEACFVCDGKGEGKIMLNLDGKTIDFSEVANISVTGSYQIGDAEPVAFGPGAWGSEDPLETLVINSVEGQINAWFGSRYAVDYKDYAAASSKIDAFYFTARTQKEGEGEDAVVVSSTPGVVYLEAVVLTKSVEQDPNAITGDMWHEWDSCTEANANIVGDFKGDVLLNTNLTAGSVFAGQMSGMVEGKIYADLSEYKGIYIKGTPGVVWRGLFNRDEMGDAGNYLNVLCPLDENGEYTLIFADFVNAEGVKLFEGAKFVHLNSCKYDWGSAEGRITKFNYIKDGQGAVDSISSVEAEGVIYNVFGQRVDENYRGIVIKNGKKYINK